MRVRLSAIILCFTLLLSLAVTGYASEGEVHVAVPEAELLDVIGITDGELLPDKPVTRYEFAGILFRAAGLSASASAEVYSGFSDVENNTENAMYVSAIRNMGIISGYSDNTFRGDENITVNEAVTATVRLLGYSSLASVKGGYPSGYSFVARELKLLSGIGEVSGYLNGESLAILISNALEAPVYEVTSVSGDTVVMNKGKLLLESALGMGLAEGIMDAHELATLSGDAVNIPPRAISVDGIIIDSGEINPLNLLGYRVKAYYRRDGDIFSLIYICPEKGKNTVREIKIEDISNIEGYTVICEEDNGKTVKFTYEKTASFIYNGAYTAYPFDPEILKDAEGSLRLLDNNGDNRADVLFLNAYTNIVTGAKINREYKLFDNYNPSKSIVLDTESDEPYVLIFDAEGNEIPFSKISKYSVVTVEKTLPDAGQAYIRAMVSDKKVTGVAEEIFDDETGSYIVIGGNRYRLSADCIENCKKEISVGKLVEAGLDIYSEAAYIRQAAGEIYYGYVIDAGMKGSFEGVPLLKIFGTDGEFKTCEIAENVEIDGKRIKNSDGNLFKILAVAAEHNQYVNGALPSGTVIPSEFYAQVLRYSFDDSGKINFVDTVLNSYENGNTVPGSRDNYEGSNRLYMENFGKLNYKVNGRNFGGKLIVRNDAKVLRIPSPLSDDLKNEELYDVTDYRFFTDNSNHAISVYYDGSEQLGGQLYSVVSSAASSSFDGESALGIVSYSSVAVDENGEALRRLYVYENGKPVVLDAPQDLEVDGLGKVSELKSGDMIYYIKDVNGKAEYILFYYRSADNSYNTSSNRGTDWADPRRIVSAYVKSVYDDGFLYKVTDNISDMNSESGYNAAISGGYPVIIYESKAFSDKNRVKTGSYSELVGFDKAGEDCSRIVIQQRYTQTKLILIIR